MMRFITSGHTFSDSLRNDTSSLHCFFARASSPLNFSLSFFNFSFSPVKSAHWVVVAPSTDPVDVEPMSSPPECDAEMFPPPDFPVAGDCITVFRRLISVRSSFCPRLKHSLANSHLSGTIFRNP
ncbi:hypothetical protein V8G54_003977 [Vigna mungo]|uniref:Uncharacterized protein n=1 Tax=Vigna mungo TaxID=3915 RepID=A0AAQ3PF44_VIGMU